MDDISVRRWLRENGYEDVAEMIDAVIAEWQAAGNKTRRNWWLVLAGGRNGKPRRIMGRVFPVLKVAQVRQGIPVTSNAISRTVDEKAPRIKPTNRWPKPK
ncbi:MAG: hypothetical protein HPY55_01025 [Firmicutes bacterium]|nr:hypothetical protein [Bacillota bacterium]